MDVLRTFMANVPVFVCFLVFGTILIEVDRNEM